MGWLDNKIVPWIQNNGRYYDSYLDKKTGLRRYQQLERLGVKKLQQFNDGSYWIISWPVEYSSMPVED